jgi:hypothetical protein
VGYPGHYQRAFIVDERDDDTQVLCLLDSGNIEETVKFDLRKVSGRTMEHHTFTQFFRISGSGY